VWQSGSLKAGVFVCAGLAGVTLLLMGASRLLLRVTAPLTRSRLFAVRLAGDGVPVFEVRPGIIATDMTAGVRDAYDRRIAGGLIPEPRWGEPDDIGRAVAALVRGDVPYATGTVLHVDGGWRYPDCRVHGRVYRFIGFIGFISSRRNSGRLNHQNPMNSRPMNDISGSSFPDQRRPVRSVGRYDRTPIHFLTTSARRRARRQSVPASGTDTRKAASAELPVRQQASRALQRAVAGDVEQPRGRRIVRPARRGSDSPARSAKRPT
jgi:hypothetical protein